MLGCLPAPLLPLRWLALILFDLRGIWRGESALEAPGGFLQLALEGFDLPGNVDELFFGENAGLGDLMGFAIRPPHGGADFHRNSREPVFPGHGIPPSATPAIVQRGRGLANSNARPPACQQRSVTPTHCLKHSLASHLVAGNVNLALIKQALGHRSISSTMVYVGTTDGQAAEAVQAALMGVF